MAEDRPLESAEQAIAALRAELEDFKSTANARMARLPTGTVLPTPATTPPAGTLLLQGQTVNRADYPALWAWAQATSAAGFGAGNGSTTFTVPDMRDRFLVGAGGAVALGATGGNATMTAANMPAHDHNVSVANHGNHNHTLTGGGGDTNGVGDHGGHNSGAFGIAAGSAGATAANGNTGGGAHSHSVQTEVFSIAASAGSHSVTESTVGSATPFDNRPPYLGVNYLIWT